MRPNESGQVQRPRDEQELLAYIRALRDQRHDYESAPHAIARAAAAAYHYMAQALGATSYQAQYADLLFLRIVRGFEGPFAILDGTDVLYPQYDLVRTVEGYVDEWRRRLAPKARELLEKHRDDPLVSRRVLARWEEIAALEDCAG